MIVNEGILADIMYRTCTKSVINLWDISAISVLSIVLPLTASTEVLRM